VREDRTAITQEVAREIKALSAAHGAVGGLDRAWEGLAPGALAQTCTPISLSPGGVLTIAAQDASARFALERWLKGGGEALVRQACAKSLRRIAVRLRARPG
jgi:hypothetical protein